jgi:hypothetical protein
MTSADDSTIDLRLEDGPFLIPLKGYQSSLVLKLQQRIEQGLAQVQSLLPGSADFYVKPILSVRQHSEESCNGNDILISAACTNSQGTQAAVDPKFFEKNGTHWASCDRYHTVSG